jgi:protein SCO1
MILRQFLIFVAALLALTLSSSALARLETPQVPLFDQTGASVRYDNLVRGRTAVIAFLFTGCSSTCPIIGQRLAQVQAKLGARAGRDVVMIGVSVDPLGDTPAAMARYSRSMGLGAGWHFVNGRADVVAQLRETLGGGQGGGNHSNFLIVSNDRTGAVSRIDAVTNTSDAIARRVLALSSGTASRAEGTARYFAAGKLLSADNRQVDFYRDVLAGQVVLIDTIFTRCTDSCPLITEKLARAQRLLGASAARVRFVSLTNDPVYDTPDKLRQFARTHGVQGNWTLLTGADKDVRAILSRFNLGGANPGDHSTALVIGNDHSGSWRRVSPAITPEQLAQLLRQVMAEAPA